MFIFSMHIQIKKPHCFTKQKGLFYKQIEQLSDINQLPLMVG